MTEPDKESSDSSYKNTDDENAGYKSKTQRKKEMLALQELGTALVGLSDNELSQIPLQGDLAAAINEARRLKQREAKRRQLQYIGRLMRDTDIDAIQTAYRQLTEKNHRHVQQHHLVEQWRERLLGENHSALTEFLQRYPDCDSQHLRQLIRGALKEQQHNKPPAQARKLFRYLRDTIS